MHLRGAARRLARRCGTLDTGRRSHCIRGDRGRRARRRASPGRSVCEEVRTRDRTRARHRLAPRPVRRLVRRTVAQHGRVGDPGAVRGGVAARGGLAGRRDALRVRAAARRRGRDVRPAGRRARHAGPAVRLRSGRRGAARADRRSADAPGRRPRAPGRHRRHRRLAAGARPRHPGVRATRATWCSPRRRPTSARCRSSRPTRPTSCTSRWTTRGSCPEALREAIDAAAPPRAAGQVPLHDPLVPQPGRRHAGHRPARRDPRRCAVAHGVLVLEDDPYGLLGFDGHRAAGDARRRRRRRRSTSARSPRRSRPGCGSAGRSRRTASARSSCSPRRRRCCARRRYCQLTVSDVPRRRSRGSTR